MKSGEVDIRGGIDLSSQTTRVNDWSSLRGILRSIQTSGPDLAYRAKNNWKELGSYLLFEDILLDRLWRARAQSRVEYIKSSVCL